MNNQERDQEIVRLLVEEQLPMVSVAERLGCGMGPVRRARKKNPAVIALFNKRKQATEERYARMRDARLAGENMHDICEREGVRGISDTNKNLLKRYPELRQRDRRTIPGSKPVRDEDEVRRPDVLAANRVLTSSMREWGRALA
ncbi:hypothetical protein [Parendozoicomonas sp. Alg238-R29]|uniref:hypothetical protein n=1 Tax=Parendozoicomonas sp. Alg238-R29 TaxID=2993446 RepID=UPI00248E27EF|nr:hypothetical protein [Parendozoicomonas sp. Alg238-R29]